MHSDDSVPQRHISSVFSLVGSLKTTTICYMKLTIIYTVIALMDDVMTVYRGWAGETAAV